MTNDLLNTFIWLLNSEEQSTLLLLAYGFTEDELRAKKTNFDKIAESIEKKFQAFRKENGLKPANIIQKLH